MRQAVTISTPASAASGMRPISGPSANTLSSSTPAWMKLTTPRHAAALDADAAAGDRRRGRHAAEERDEHIADALADQLLVAVQRLAGHRRADRAAQQALDRAQRGDRDRRPAADRAARPTGSRPGQPLSSRMRARDRADDAAPASRPAAATSVASTMPTSEPGTALRSGAAAAIIVSMTISRQRHGVPIGRNRMREIAQQLERAYSRRWAL